MHSSVRCGSASCTRSKKVIWLAFTLIHLSAWMEVTFCEVGPPLYGVLGSWKRYGSGKVGRWRAGADEPDEGDHHPRGQVHERDARGEDRPEQPRDRACG